MPGNYKTDFRRYKRKLRWKATMRKTGSDEDAPFNPEEYPSESLENRIFQGGRGHCPECAQPLGMLANGQYHCPACGYIGGYRLEDMGR